MMMIPRREKNLNFFDDFFNDSFFTRAESKIMKTDIKEKDGQYELRMDLPGYDKENIKIHIEDGYLYVDASMSKHIEEEKEGKYLHQERYVGECSRSFYVGHDVKESDIKANLKNGILMISIPKKEQERVKEKKYISIDGE